MKVRANRGRELERQASLPRTHHPRPSWAHPHLRQAENEVDKSISLKLNEHISKDLCGASRGRRRSRRRRTLWSWAALWCKGPPPPVLPRCTAMSPTQRWPARKPPPFRMNCS